APSLRFPLGVRQPFSGGKPAMAPFGSRRRTFAVAVRNAWVGRFSAADPRAARPV
ncbi:MAG: hypothetical protein AVDCRST_MAG08-2649, partial [uncultured Acetobacteraceae bacterium]